MIKLKGYKSYQEAVKKIESKVRASILNLLDTEPELVLSKAKLSGASNDLIESAREYLSGDKNMPSGAVHRIIPFNKHFAFSCRLLLAYVHQCAPEKSVELSGNSDHLVLLDSMKCKRFMKLRNLSRIDDTNERKRLLLPKLPYWITEGSVSQDNGTEINYTWLDAVFEEQFHSSPHTTVGRLINYGDLSSIISHINGYISYNRVINQLESLLSSGCKPCAQRANGELIRNLEDTEPLRIFDGWSIVISDKFIDEICDMFDAGKTEKNSELLSLTAENIIKIWRSDNDMNKEMVRAHFPDSGVRRFNLYWSFAAEQFPEISKPGRKS